MYIGDKLEANAQKLKVSPFLSGKDMNLGNRVGFNDCVLKIAIGFTGDVWTKASSATLIQLTALIRQAEQLKKQNIWVDFFYQPCDEDRKVLEKNNLPLVFGWASMRTLDEMDVIFHSFSIHYELMHVVGSWLGSKGAVPMFHSERAQDDNAPLVIAGGVIADLLEPLHGHRKGSLVDLVHLGEGEEVIPAVVCKLLELNNRFPGSIKDNKYGTIEELLGEFPTLYYPDGYKVEYNEKGRTVSIKPQLPWVPEMVDYHRSYDKAPPMFENRIMVTTNDGAARGELQVSHGCPGYGACFFCHEGNLAGPWREYSKEGIERAFDTLKTTCAPNVVSLYSFNSNFHSEAFELYHNIAKNFSYISVIALRADVVAAEPMYVKLLKTLGTFRITVALEGISSRIRDKLLNKNLSWEQFFQACRYAFEQKFIMLKANLIYTGHETQEDIDEFNQKMTELVQMRNDLGAKTSLMFSATTLVAYPNVGMWYKGRNSTFNEYNRIRTFKGIVAHGREIGIRFRFNSGPDFVFQQLLVDGARFISETLIDEFTKAFNAGINFTNGKHFATCNEAVFEVLGIRGDMDGIKEYLLKTWELDEPTPYSHMNIVPRKAREMVREAVDNHGIKYCLATPANPNPVCKNCGFCKDGWQVKNLLKRDFHPKCSIEDIQKAVFENKPRSSMRVVYQTSDHPLARSKFKLVNDHFMAGRILRMQPRWRDSFHNVRNYSDYIMVQHGQYDGWSGVGFFDMTFRMQPEELKEMLAAMDHRFITETMRIINMFQVPINTKLRNPTHVWQFITDLPRTALVDAFGAYNGELKTMDKGAAGAPAVITKPLPKNEIGLYTTTNGLGQTYGTFTLGHRFNPFMALWSFFGGKRGLQDIKEDYRVARIGVLEEGLTPCPKCGNPSGINLLTGRVAQVCGDCQAKLYALKNKA